MKRFIAISGLTIILIFGGCSGTTQTNFGLSTIDENGKLSSIASESPVEVLPTPKVAPAPVVSKTDVILLPLTDGKVGKVIVSDDAKATMLNRAWQKVETKDIYKKEILSKEIVESKYAQLLAGMPEEPNNHRIYFNYDSTSIANNSSNQWKEMLKDIKSNSVLEIDVIGYSDRAGDDVYNKVLSMKCAQKVAELLKNEGIENEIISLDYYGEENPIVPTEDGVANELNRRVEVTIK